MVEQSPRFEEIKIPLPEPISGVEEITTVLGIPEWWPTGSRVAVALAHGAPGDMDEPLIRGIAERLTERRFLTLRFNFPFGEAGRRSADPLPALETGFRAALSVFGRDASQAPAHLVLGGKGIGATAAQSLATARLRLAGLFNLGYPLHPQDRPEKIQADDLFRITCPMLFVQGTRDRRCNLEALRQTLQGVGASTQLHVCEDADQHFRAPKRSLRNEEEIQTEVFDVLADWLGKVIGEI